MLRTDNNITSELSSRTSLNYRAYRALAHEAAERRQKLIEKSIREFEERQMIELEFETYRMFKGVAF